MAQFSRAHGIHAGAGFTQHLAVQKTAQLGPV
jgi:hypothetical protein